MPSLTPVDYDPFSEEPVDGAPSPTDAVGVPVDYDPFAQEPAAAQVPTTPVAPAQATDVERVAGHPLTRFAVGVASPVLGAFQLGTNIGDWMVARMGGTPVLGKKVNEILAEFDAMKRAGMAARQGVAQGEEGFDWAGLGGAVLGPSTALIKGGTSVFGIGTAPAVTRGAKIAEGARVGGAFGATTPVTSGDESVLSEQGVGAVTGTALGAAVPAAVGIAKGAGGMVRDVYDLVSSAGPQRIANRYLDRILPENRGPIISALENNKSPILGYQLTAAEATSGIPEGTVIRAQQDITARSAGNVAPAFNKRIQEQNSAITRAIDTIAGNEAKMTAAETSRRINAEKLYGAARKVLVKNDSELNDLFENPYFSMAVKDSAALSAAKGVTPEKRPVEFLENVKYALDKMIGPKSDKPMAEKEVEAVMQVRGRLINWLEEKTKDASGASLYGAARKQYASDSAPIDRMRVGQELKEKLIPALVTEAEGEAPMRLAAYSDAMRNPGRTIKTATGFPRYTKLSDVLTPDEVAMAENIAKTLAMRQQPLQKTSLPGGVDVVKETVGTLPSVLSRPVVIAKDLMRRRAGKGGVGIEAAVDEVMAQYFLNPKEFAQAIKSLTPGPRSIALSRYANIVRNPALIGLGQYAIRENQAQEDQPTQ